MYVEIVNKKNQEQKMQIDNDPWMNWKGSKPLINIQNLINVDDRWDPDAPEHCILCGKGIYTKSIDWVRCVGGHEVIAHKDDIDHLETDKDAMAYDMFHFPIGSVCINKIKKGLKKLSIDPNGYIFKFDSMNHKNGE